MNRDLSTPCAMERELPAYLQDELPPDERRAVESHLSACAACREALNEYRALLGALRESAPAARPVDVSDAVLRRLPGIGTTRSFWRRAPLRAAALWVLAGALVFVLAARMLRPTCGADTAAATTFSAERAVRWLVSAQQLDGRWDVQQAAPPSRYSVGLTALSMMAFSGEPVAQGLPECREAIRRGAEFLVAQQAGNGRFGPIGSATMYNTAMAVVALLRAGGIEPNDAFDGAARRGVAFILSEQRAGGGWGYVRESPDSMNTSITVWQLLALMEAETAGRNDLREPIERGLAWVASTMDTEGRVGYAKPRDFPYGHATMTAAGALCAMKRSAAAPRLVDALLAAARESRGEHDFYRTYFVTAALGEHGGAEAASRLRELQGELQRRQIAAGPHAGAWDATDRWSSAGGRVYTTTMAMMALQVSPHSARDAKRPPS